MTARRVFRAAAPPCLAFALTYAASSCALREAPRARIRIAPEPTASADEPPPSLPTATKAAVVRIEPKNGDWTFPELFDEIERKAGVSILYDTSDAKLAQAKIQICGTHEVAVDELHDWLQAVLSYRKLVVTRVSPKGVEGKQQWLVSEHRGPPHPTYIEADDLEKYADRDGLYVVTKLTLARTRDTAAVRNALSPLSTPEDGIGRIREMPGEHALIVGDYAPVVVAMKRIVDLMNSETPAAK